MSDQYREQANAIAQKAGAIAEGKVAGVLWAHVQQLKDMVLTLEAWTEDDRV